MNNETYHATCVGCRDPIHESAPDVKELTLSALGICTALVALLSTRLDIVAIKEGKAHIL